MILIWDILPCGLEKENGDSDLKFFFGVMAKPPTRRPWATVPSDAPWWMAPKIPTVTTMALAMASSKSKSLVVCLHPV